MIEITTIRWTTFRFTCDYCWCLNRVDVDAWTHAVQVVQSAVTDALWQTEKKP